MLTSRAHMATENASKYLVQLCKHFAHKVAVEHDDHQASFTLGSGPASMTADAQGLTVTVTGEDAKALIQARYVIDSHLVTFAFRENFSGFQWSVAA
jgi:hypothetical protein